MAQYYTFKDSTLPAVELAGGKGLSLLYSKKKGFNVPTCAGYLSDPPGVMAVETTTLELEPLSAVTRSLLIGLNEKQAILD